MSGSNNVILTGTPRGGTTLTCHLLNKLPDLVALNEPMDVLKFANHSRSEICVDIERFFQQERHSIITRRVATSKHVDGQIPDNLVTKKSANGLRERRDIQLGQIIVDNELTADFLLVIKHPSAFTAMLADLKDKFPCYAIVRNPLALLRSWNCVPFSIRSGHVPAAELIDTKLADALSKISNVLDRQIYLLAWFFDNFQRNLCSENVIRYEEIISTGGAAIAPITPRALQLDEKLESENANSAYDHDLMRPLAEKLLKSNGSYWDFYSRESVIELVESDSVSF